MDKEYTTSERIEDVINDKIARWIKAARKVCIKRAFDELVGV